MNAMYVLQYHPITFVLLQMIHWHLIRVPCHQAIMLAKDRCLNPGPQHKSTIQLKQTAPPKSNVAPEDQDDDQRDKSTH